MKKIKLDYRIKTTAVGIGLLIIAIVILYLINAFFDTYRFRFQFPIIIRVPVWIERRNPVVIKEKVIPTPTPTPKSPIQTGVVPNVLADDNKPSEYAIVMGKKNGSILWKMYQLESQRGKTDPCRKQGKFNGFGYIPGTCYDFFEDVVNRVDTWLTNHLQNNSLSVSLCEYNLGDKNEHVDECTMSSLKYPYYKDYLKLSNNE